MKKVILTKFRTDPITLYLYNIKNYCEDSYGFTTSNIDRYEKGLIYCINETARNLLDNIKGEWEYTVVISATYKNKIITEYDYVILDKKEVIND